MDATRWNNLLDVRHAYETGAPVTGESPLEAFFEVAARCNLHCQMCAINYDSRYLPGSKRPPYLTPQLFEKLEPMFPRLVRAYLFGLGEPLLNKHLLDYVRTISGHGAEVWFNTNATLIDDEKAEALARAGATAITVSIDGATKETYERIRVGAKHEAVLRGIRALVRASRRHGRPRVDLSFVGMASNLHELPALVDLAADVGAGGIHVEPLYSQIQHDLQEHYARENLGILGSGRVDELFGAARDRAAERGVRLASRFLTDRGAADYVDRAKQFEIWWTCNEAWTSIWVTAAGEVRTCCLNDTSFGNLFDASFADVWNGEAFRAFRSQHAAGRGGPATCANCIRNGRVRHSPYLAALEPVTYRPLRSRSERPEASDAIEWPAEGDIVTDPLSVVGRLGAATGDAPPDLVIDRTFRIPLAAAGVVEGDRFGAVVDVPFLSEGAHLLSLRRPGSGDDLALRAVHVWRPAARRESSDGPVTPQRATGFVAIRRPLERRASAARVRLDGRPVEATWICGRVAGGRLRREWAGIAGVDLSSASPGPHTVTLEPDGHEATSHAVERLPLRD